MAIEVNFKTNIQLKSIIGKDLINDDNIAILELVKNAFDANSDKVKITYLNLKNNDDEIVDSYSANTSRIIIQDEGCGMSLEDIKNKWLNIAYSEKKQNKIQNKRHMAGAKGVGRFSCDRLGKFLNLYSKISGDDQVIRLEIDWSKFEIEDQDKEIQTIPLKIEQLSCGEVKAKYNIDFLRGHGVCLEIIKLRSFWTSRIVNKDKSVSWSTEKFYKLKQYLEKLINPSQAFETESDQFGIFLYAPEFELENDSKPLNEKFLGSIKNRIFEKLDFQTTSIESNTYNDGIDLYTVLKDRGEVIFYVKEKNPFYPAVKNARLTLYYLNPYAKAFFTKQTGIQSVNYGSIFLFINGFRVPPYGEVDNDWLNLNSRKAQGINRFLGVREVLGNVEIIDNFNDFQIISSREGIVKNDNYYQLCTPKNNNSFIFKAFRRLERYVVEGIAWDSIPEDLVDSYDLIEKKIISGELTERDLSYREDDFIKRQRIYGAIHSIISARPENVLELYINESLISEKIEYEKKKSEQEFEQLIEDFNNKKIDSETLNRILKRKVDQNKELEKELNEFLKYETSPITTQALVELKDYKRKIEEQTEIIKNLQAQLNKIEKEKEALLKQQKEYELQKTLLERKVWDEKSKRQKAEFQLERKTNQVLFLQSLQTLDIDSMNRYYHTIGVEAAAIQNWLTNINERLAKGTIDDKFLHRFIVGITHANERILSISRFATKANINMEGESRSIDIISFVEQYINNITKAYSDIEVEVHNLTNNVLIIEFKPIEISILLDNIVNNSIKAGAKHLDVLIQELSSGDIEFRFSDDGAGLDPNIENPDDLFEKGYTTTNGSGIGLYDASNIVKKLTGYIFVNKTYRFSELKKGFELIIILKR